MLEPLLILALIPILIICFPKDNEGVYDLFNKKFTEGLRGIAILLIVFCHVASCFGSRYFSPIGGPGSAIFILVSGYGINESFKRYGFKGYWKKKIVKVWFPYFIIITLFLLVGRCDLLSYFKYCTTVSSPYWFVSFVFLNYLIFYITTKYFYKHRFLLMLIASFLILFRGGMFATQAFSFVLGVYFSENISKIRNVSSKKILMIGVFAFIFGTIFLSVKQLPYIRSFIDTNIYSMVECCVKLPYAISIISFVALIPNILRSKVILFLSAIAYQLYLVHMPFYPFIKGRIHVAFAVIIGSVLLAWMYKYFCDYSAKKMLK